MNNNKSTINQPNMDKRSQSLQANNKQVAGQSKTLDNAATKSKSTMALADKWKEESSTKINQGTDFSKKAQSSKKLEGQTKESDDFYRGEVIRPYAESEGKEMSRKSEVSRPYTDASEEIKREQSLQPHVDVDDSEIPGEQYLNGKTTKDIDKKFTGAGKSSRESSKRSSQQSDYSGAKGASQGSEFTKQHASKANSESSRGQGLSQEDTEVSRRQDYDKRGSQSSQQQKVEKDSNFPKRKV